ncbi:MAG TPA: M48 family metallopeptidase [Steroidobacteraceae bacterium]|nr:M48 family metallopeptidase [Steroidobacteraceae bacterium]
MSTQFFERQETQRSYTKWLVLSFIGALLVVTAAINLVVLVGLFGEPFYIIRHHPEYVAWISGVVIGTMLVASWHKSSELRAGGAVVARALGGVPVTAQDSDLKRQRLLNIVEEMAIAARIRKPQVFVLTEEPGINAFAAGHSPDEAAVAVTQGALDNLDRDQLQAVIGHEFSHVLNGDMKINMRLAAWIFGLFIITNIATRIMRNRSRGKGAARLKLVALGVFIAGSVGLIAGRLLQAAVSRRREHLADASSVQFTRNPQALQGAFIAMAANAQGSRLQHASAVNVAHMFFAHSDPPWADKVGTGWFSTHPKLEERVKALDSRVTPARFRTLVNEERRKIAARDAQSPAETTANGEVTAAVAPGSTPAAAPGDVLAFTPAEGTAAIAQPVRLATQLAAAASTTPASTPPATLTPAGTAPAASGATTRSRTISGLALAETLPSGIRMIGGRSLPPDVLRNRLSQEQQQAIVEYLARVEKSLPSVQATFIAAMLASEPAKTRTQVTKLAPLLGIELMKECQAQWKAINALPAPARLPMLMDLASMLDALDPADRKKLRAIARAFAPTVATGDMLRFAVTRLIEKRLAKATEPSPPVPLPERAAAVCELYAALAQCRFGAGKPGLNAYRAGLMGMLPPQKWAVFPETLIAPAALDAALAGLAGVHPTGKRSLSEGMARVVAVGGRLTVPLVDLLRAACVLIDCPVPMLAPDVVYDEADTAPRTQASAR